MPFTLRNLRDYVMDPGSGFDGAPDMAFRHTSTALEFEPSGLSYQRIRPDYRFSYEVRSPTGRSMRRRTCDRGTWSKTMKCLRREWNAYLP